MNRDEALSIKADLDARGCNTQIITFDDGESGVSVVTKAGPTVGVPSIELLELSLEIVEQLS